MNAPEILVDVLEHADGQAGREARIEDVLVDPGARGLGVGRALYASLGFVPRETGVFRHALDG